MKDWFIVIVCLCIVITFCLGIVGFIGALIWLLGI